MCLLLLLSPTAPHGRCAGSLAHWLRSLGLNSSSRFPFAVSFSAHSQGSTRCNAFALFHPFRVHSGCLLRCLPSVLVRLFLVDSSLLPWSLQYNYLLNSSPFAFSIFLLLIFFIPASSTLHPSIISALTFSLPLDRPSSQFDRVSILKSPFAAYYTLGYRPHSHTTLLSSSSL